MSVFCSQLSDPIRNRTAGSSDIAFYIASLENQEASVISTDQEVPHLLALQVAAGKKSSLAESHQEGANDAKGTHLRLRLGTAAHGVGSKGKASEEPWIQNPVARKLPTTLQDLTMVHMLSRLRDTPS